MEYRVGVSASAWRSDRVGAWAAIEGSLCCRPYPFRLRRRVQSRIKAVVVASIHRICKRELFEIVNAGDWFRRFLGSAQCRQTHYGQNRNTVIDPKQSTKD